jgi:hypothetical protein
MQKKPGESEIQGDSVSRTGLSTGAIKSGVQEHLKYSQGKIPAIATLNDKYMALCEVSEVTSRPPKYAETVKMAK